MIDFDQLLGQFTDDPGNAPYIDRRSGVFYGSDDAVLARFPGRDIPKDDWNVFIPIDADGDVEKAKRHWDEMESRHREKKCPECGGSGFIPHHPGAIARFRVKDERGTPCLSCHDQLRRNLYLPESRKMKGGA